jgi:UDP-2,3-diacylglucosamine pyrophosphatase LpxH
MSHLVGVRVYQQYVWHYAGMRHLAIHGHQFDRLVANNLRLNYLGTLLYLQLEKLDLKGQPVARFFDRLNTRWLRMSSKVASGALFHARQQKADRIFCGHTHVAMQQERDGLHYYNAGGWIDSKPTFITIDEEGVRIHEYQHRTDHRDSSEERGDTDSPVAEFAGESGLPGDVEYQNIGS